MKTALAIRDIKQPSNPNCIQVTEYLTTDHAVQYLREQCGVSLTVGSLVMRRNERGLLPKYLKIGRAVRYRESDLREFAKLYRAKRVK